VKTGSSYCSQSELPITFGLGKAEEVSKIEVLWPSGQLDTITGVKANQAITIKEARGVVSAEPIIFSHP
jgi:hypothetical protein